MATTTQEMTAVIANFADRRHAERFVAALKRAGFRDQEIGVLSPGHEKTVESVEEGAVAGALTGGGIGLVAGALATGVIPGIGPVIAAGLLAGILGGAAAGATTGGILGALIGLGVSEEQAREHEQAFRSGHTLVVVQSPMRGAEALAILRQCEKMA